MLPPLNSTAPVPGVDRFSGQDIYPGVPAYRLEHEQHIALSAAALGKAGHGI